MNALVLKWLTSSIVGLVVCSAIWLAGSVRLHPSASSYRLASVAGSTAAPTLPAHKRVPQAASFAASAALQNDIALR
jgi:hypothetical protein